MTTSFEELLNSTEMLKKGDKVTGIVSRIDGDLAYIDVDGAQYDCVISKSQISRNFVKDIRDVLNIGDKIEAVVTGVRTDRERKSEDLPGVIYLSRKIIENQEYKKIYDLSWVEIVELFEKGEYVTAKVTETTKGGLLANLKGVRAFIPASNIDIKFVKNLNNFVNKEYTFKIDEADKSKNKVILNRKVILEEEENKKLDEIFSKLNVGDILEGKVNRISNFGLFVNIGEIDGLVHISEISHKRFAKIEDVISVGETVKVAILGLDKENGRVSLSIKALLPTQWEIAKASFKEGDELEGIVKNITDFGAFVEILPDVEGLVHLSQISHERIEKATDVLSVGETVKVKLIGLDIENKRISLSIKDLLEKPVKEEVIIEPDFDTSYLKSEETEYSIADKFKELS